MTTEFLINHLWQSSCFVLVAALLALALRANSPKVRYWIWLSASLKFLIPFALLVDLGNLAPRPTPSPVAAPAPLFPTPLVQIAEPFSPDPSARILAQTPTPWLPITLAILWTLGFLALTLARCRSWSRVRATLRNATPLDLPIPVPTRLTSTASEPGIVGFLRPVLVLPAQLLEHLNPRQLSAILAHELSHVQRRDNLFAAVHMLVEALFWFHPFVWWIGARLLEERELVCDEEVLRLGCEPADYVEGILKVCRFYTESPLPCISGVTGADVKKRLRTILAGTLAQELNRAKKFTLATTALATLAAPIVIGMLNAPVIRAQTAPPNTPKFEVASIRRCQEPLNDGGPNSSPGHLDTDCAELLNLIGNAYTTFADGYLNLNSDPTPLTGGPSWLHSASYEINAKAEGNATVSMMKGPMLQRLLEDRFQLKIHRETTEGPVYFLTVARGGTKLTPFTAASCTPYSSFPRPPLQPGTEYCERTISALGSPKIEAKGATLDEFSKTLRLLVDRPVIDKTGISGRFNLLVHFSREGTSLEGIPGGVPGRTPDPAGPPSIFTAIQEQLGLKLESGRGPVDTLVIDHIERPTEN